jgi:hypothetical protein
VVGCYGNNNTLACFNKSSQVELEKKQPQHLAMAMVVVQLGLFDSMFDGKSAITHHL